MHIEAIAPRATYCALHNAFGSHSISEEIICRRIGSMIAEYRINRSVPTARSSGRPVSGAERDDSPALREITLLWLRALLAWAFDDALAYGYFLDRYRTMAAALQPVP